MTGQTCQGKESISISFWIRMHGGKRILATGSYTLGDKGPGILMEYDDDLEILKVEFANDANGEKVWRINMPMRR